jgi:CheY-like chemotaxis protein
LQQILVIQNVELWIKLNRHYAGSDSVRVTEAASWDEGVRLAEAQAPEVVICASETPDLTFEHYDELVERSALDASRVVFVRASGDERIPAGKLQISLCTSGELVDLVDRKLVTAVGGERPTGRAVTDLLSQFETDGPDGEVQRGFVNLLEIDMHSAVLEGSEPLKVGDTLRLTFFLPRLPDAPPGSGRHKAALPCRVDASIDETRLLYSVRIQRVEEQDREALQSFISTRLPQHEV